MEQELICPYCQGEFPLDLPGTVESECPLCGKEIFIEWEAFPDGTETYWVRDLQESEK